MKIFKKSSQYYDLLYRNKNYSKESNFINKFIKKEFKKNIDILEIGCGTGRHAQELAKSKFNLYCIDPSKDMIKIAKKKNKKKNIIFKHTTFENLKIKKKFDVSLSLFHVINYFDSLNKIKKFFDLNHKFLKKNGVLFFDFWHGDGVEKDPPKKSLKIYKNRNLNISRFASTDISLKKKQAIINYNYEIFSKKKMIKFSEKHKLRYLFKEYIKKFSSKKFKILKIGKWMTLDKIQKKDWLGYAILKAK